MFSLSTIKLNGPSTDLVPISCVTQVHTGPPATSPHVCALERLQAGHGIKLVKVTGSWVCVFVCKDCIVSVDTLCFHVNYRC